MLELKIKVPEKVNWVFSESTEIVEETVDPETGETVFYSTPVDVYSYSAEIIFTVDKTLFPLRSSGTLYWKVYDAAQIKKWDEPKLVRYTVKYGKKLEFDSLPYTRTVVERGQTTVNKGETPPKLEKTVVAYVVVGFSEALAEENFTVE